MRHYWTTVEMANLRISYPHRPTSDLAKESGRTKAAVLQMALKLGLHKSEAYMRGPIVRWQPGHRPWNFGKHYEAGGMAKLTQFKKGHRGARQKPVGSERRNKDGWVEVKVAEPSVWVSKARHVWEQHFGKIPAGAIVRLKDKRKNFSPRNLQLVDRAEHVRLNWKPRGSAKGRAIAWIAPLKLAA